MSEVTAAIFRGGKVIEHVALDTNMPQQGDSAFIWVEVLNPLDGDFDVLQERFGLHSLAVKDSMSPTQAPKIDVYDDQIFVVLKIARLLGDEVHYAAIDAFVSGHHIITVRHGDDAEYAHAHEKFRSGPASTQPAPDFILHAIMDFVVNSYFPVVQMIEDEVLSMEQRLLDAFLGRGSSDVSPSRESSRVDQKRQAPDSQMAFASSTSDTSMISYSSRACRCSKKVSPMPTPYTRSSPLSSSNSTSCAVLRLISTS